MEALEVTGQPVLNNATSLCTCYTHWPIWENSEAKYQHIHSPGSPRSNIPVTLTQATYLPPPSSFHNNRHSSITYTHNQYRLSAVIDPDTVCTQLLRPDCGLLPGIKDPEKDTWSPAPGSPQPSPRYVECREIKREHGHQRLLLYTRTLNQFVRKCICCRSMTLFHNIMKCALEF